MVTSCPRKPLWKGSILDKLLKSSMVSQWTGRLLFLQNKNLHALNPFIYVDRNFEWGKKTHTNNIPLPSPPFSLDISVNRSIGHMID